jgi:hypothetical protein
MASLPSLPVGTAWVWSPGWLDVFQRVRIGRKETFDSSATPKIGAVRREPKTLAPVYLERLRTRLAGTMEQKHADDPRELRRRIAKLERAARPQVIVEPVEVPVLPPAQITTLQELVAGLRAVADEISSALANVQGHRDGHAPDVRLSVSTSVPMALPRRRTRKDVAVSLPPHEGLQLRAGERRMLHTLAQRYPTTLTRAQLGTLAGFTPSGGTFGAYFGTLKRYGLLTEAANGEVEITQAGLAYLGSDVPPPPQTTAEVLAMWRRALRAGEWRLLETFVAAYPGTLSRDALGAHTGFTPTGGTFSTYLGTLRRNSLIEVTGDQVWASQTLFLV